MNDIETKLLTYLSNTKQATVWLEQLEQLFEGEPIAYESFATVVLNMETSEILSGVRSSGRTTRTPSLAIRYRIQHSKIRMNFQQRLHQLRLNLHPLISLDRYFALGEAYYNIDEPYIEMIDQYLKEVGLPDCFNAAPERSYALVRDEKWITEKNGKSLLIRIGLWDKLLITAEYDPLMMAVNPELQGGSISSDPCLHLIVENKTTFQALLPGLSETVFQTLIYGCGNKIVGNIEMFSKQYPVHSREHYFYYFGDIDHKGIQIWNDLSLRVETMPAIPFYEACVRKASTKGKEYQRVDGQALLRFLAFFTDEDSKRMSNSLAKGSYYPQEILSTQELLNIWRDTPWRELNHLKLNKRY
jgi:hypothetical protein